MKIQRYKKVNKHISFYTNNYGFRQPYQLLLDGTFCFVALNNQVNISDIIPKYLQGDVKLLTTQCAVLEMEKLGYKLNGALLILKKFATHKCGHEGKPIAASKCLYSMLGKKNENHYVIATQDRDLQERLRKVPGVPLLYLHMKTPNLEAPSEVSVKYAKEKLSGLGDYEKRALEELKKQSGLAEDANKVRRKKKKKGANPLSCKKKKKKVVGGVSKSGADKGDIEKKKRKRVRIAQHVKEEILKKANKTAE